MANDKSYEHNHGRNSQFLAADSLTDRNNARFSNCQPQVTRKNSSSAQLTRFCMQTFSIANRAQVLGKIERELETMY